MNGSTVKVGAQKRRSSSLREVNLDQIKAAVDANRVVYWKTKEYIVCKEIPVGSSIPHYFIRHTGGQRVDLTWSDEVTLHGEEVDFTTNF